MKRGRRKCGAPRPGLWPVFVSPLHQCAECDHGACAHTKDSLVAAMFGGTAPAGACVVKGCKCEQFRLPAAEEGK